MNEKFDKPQIDKVSNEKSNKPRIDKVSVEFSQEGNTLGTTSECETIEISLESQLSEDGHFIVIKTDGWSIDNTSELLYLIKRTEKILKD